MVQQISGRRRAGWAVAAAVGVPAVAEIVAAAAGGSTGLLFQAGAVLGACGAAWLATRRGLWWLLPAQPMIVVPLAVAGVALTEPDGTKKTKVGTDELAALQHAFPITLAALAAVVIVAAVKEVRRRSASPGRPAASGHRAAAGSVRTTGARRG